MVEVEAVEAVEVEDLPHYSHHDNHSNSRMSCQQLMLKQWESSLTLSTVTEQRQKTSLKK